MNEAELIAALKQKDEAAFRQLVENWQDRIYNTALGFLQEEADAEDVTQEVFVSAYRKLDGFRGDAGLGTWLYRIAVNKSLDLLRQRKPKQPAGESIDFFHPGVALEKKQDAALLFSAIRGLPENQQVAYQLQQLEGLNQREIAAVMRLSESAVEGLLGRARANLRKKLQQYFDKKANT